MAFSSVVIKVRFGETLRRLNASISDEKLVLDMAMLKEKIRSLFSFGSEVEFTMTYIDEDGDEVTLADDDDLQDVVRQSLDPLRITVSSNSSNFNGPNGDSTLLRSPQNQHPFQALNSGVSEILTSVPEQLFEALAKLPLDLASKASSSAPGVAELVEEMKDVYLNQILPSMARPGINPTTGGPPNVNSESSSVKNSNVKVNPEAGGSNSKKKEKQVQKVTEGVKFKDAQPPRDVDLNIPYFEYGSFQAPISSAKGSTGQSKNTTDGIEEKKKSSSVKKDDISSGSLNELLKHDSFVEQIKQRQGQMNQMRQNLQGKIAAQRAQFARVATIINKNTNDSDNSSGLAQGMLNATNQCPFSGMPLTSSDSDSQGHCHRSRSPHGKRNSRDNNYMGNIFHRGVICDGCGAHPITGPRFKSKLKTDYDLCNVCFAGMGNATDYIRIDHPTSHFRHHLMPFKGFYDPFFLEPGVSYGAASISFGIESHANGAPGSKLSWSNLDSQFILDVNVLDGTTMAPFTAFTKIWRMRNNGSIVWPYGSQFQWIGGDRLTNSLSVDVEIPVDGLPVDKEVDIAVDFTAPELPGQYVSYWRMVSPSGQKFGQHVWVLIQVDASLKNLGETSINLNLPSVTRDPVAVNQDHPDGNIFFGNNIVTDPENTSGYLQPRDYKMNFPFNNSLIIDNGGVPSTMATLSAPPETASSSVFNPTEVGTALGSLPSAPTVTSGLASAPISYPTVDFSVMPPIMSSGAASLPMVVVQPASGFGGGMVSDDQEQALVAMGFKQLDLNKKILRKNNYDLDKTIDDLFGVLEWDPILAELREMGFADDEVNRRLLKKNNGSIVSVVMDLINEETA